MLNAMLYPDLDVPNAAGKKKIHDGILRSITVKSHLLLYVYMMQAPSGLQVPQRIKARHLSFCVY